MVHWQKLSCVVLFLFSVSLLQLGTLNATDEVSPVDKPGSDEEQGKGGAVGIGPQNWQKLCEAMKKPNQANDCMYVPAKGNREYAKTINTDEGDRDIDDPSALSFALAVDKSKQLHLQIVPCHGCKGWCLTKGKDQSCRNPGTGTTIAANVKEPQEVAANGHELLGMIIRLGDHAQVHYQKGVNPVIYNLAGSTADVGNLVNVYLGANDVLGSYGDNDGGIWVYWKVIGPQ